MKIESGIYTAISPNFFCVKILWKRIVSAEFRAIRCRECAFPQNFHIRKLSEVTIFYAVIYSLLCKVSRTVYLWGGSWEKGNEERHK